MSVASAIILIVSRLGRSKVRPSVSEIAEATSVADTTLRGTAAGMYPYAVDFVPPSYVPRETAAKVIKMMQSHPQ